ncbi:MAG: hypothetical protein M3228_03460 [Actinomycetota bacterium]|nr:hypothetical protein [Actinomycetota bacterium]
MTAQIPKMMIVSARPSPEAHPVVSDPISLIDQRLLVYIAAHHNPRSTLILPQIIVAARI